MTAVAASRKPLQTPHADQRSLLLVELCCDDAPSRYQSFQSLIIHSKRRSCALRADWWVDLLDKSLLYHINASSVRNFKKECPVSMLSTKQ